MGPGRDSPGGSPVSGLAEEVFAALPWPCVVWPRDGGPAVMANEAFRREFGTLLPTSLPDWFTTHLEPGNANDEFVIRIAERAPRRFRLTRQPLDLAPAAFDAAFLMPLPDDEPGSDEPTPNSFAMLRPDVSLTRRESQVLDGIMSGKLNKVIAAELNISHKTVELHRANLMAKLRVHNVVELARVVLEPPAVGRRDEAPAETEPVTG